VISLQILGLIYRIKSKKTGELRAQCEDPCCDPADETPEKKEEEESVTPAFV
jgi:hypothetical protein